MGAVKLEPVLDSAAAICGDRDHVCLVNSGCRMNIFLFYLFSLVFLVLICAVAVLRHLPACRESVPAEISAAFYCFSPGEGDSWKDELLELARSKHELNMSELRCLLQVITDRGLEKKVTSSQGSPSAYHSATTWTSRKRYQWTKYNTSRSQLEENVFPHSSCSLSSTSEASFWFGSIPPSVPAASWLPLWVTVMSITRLNHTALTRTSVLPHFLKGFHLNPMTNDKDALTVVSLWL